MATDRNAFKAGLFIVISLALIVAVIIAIKGVGRFIEPQQRRYVEFSLQDDVSGLRVGDDVRVGGLKVGIIHSIDIETGAKDADTRVLIYFKIPERIVVREGARISVQSTLTGTAWLNFDKLGDGQPMAQDKPLKGMPGTFAVLARSLNDLGPEVQRLAADIRTITLPKVNKTTDNASETIVALKGKLDGIVERYNTVMDHVAAASGHLRDILGDTKGDFRKTMANVSASTDTLKTKLPKVMEDFDKLLTKVNTELESTTGVLAEIRMTATNTKDATGSIRSILARNKSKIDEMIQALKTAGDNVKFATAEIRHSPWRLLYKPRAGEVANLNLYDATRQFAEGANDLSDAATALRDALDDPQADKTKIEDLVQRLDETFGQFQKVETDLWKRVKE